MTTYKYFLPDDNLRAAYGGAAIVNNGDSAEISKIGLLQRHLSRQLGWPSGHTRYIGEVGTVSGVKWMRISDNLYPAISPHLTAAELATITSTKPVGYTGSSQTIEFQPIPTKTKIFWRSDSIGNGQGTTAGDGKDAFVTQAINSIAGETLVFSGGEDRTATSQTYWIANMSIGSSSWANTGGGGPAVYPNREDLAFNQRTRTLPLNGDKTIFIYWLGSNDINYDPGSTGAIVWARAAARIAALRAEFPNLKIIACTLIRRGEDDVTTQGSQNYKLNAYNVLARANYLSAGANILLDLDTASTELNVATGDTTNTTYYPDGVHITTAGHALLAPTTATAILDAVALF